MQKLYEFDFKDDSYSATKVTDKKENKQAVEEKNPVSESEQEKLDSEEDEIDEQNPYNNESSIKASESGIDQSRVHLIENNREFYKSIKNDKIKTSLTINKSNVMQSKLSERKESTQDKAKTTDLKIVKSVNEMAGILVKSVINQALNDKSTRDITDPKSIEKKYRYNFSAKKQGEINLNEFNSKKTNSRLGYYKDYQTENENKNDFSTNEIDDGKFVIEFEDEPYEFVFNLIF